MDKKYLEEQMSAYLDGELSPGEMSKYEQEIKAYPDLFAELQTLQRLNKLAEGSKLAMPDDGYFENLAGRIDSRIASELTGQKSRIVDFIVERRKAIAVVSSIAAVFLVAVISMNLFGPSAKRYPNELPTHKTAPTKVVDQDSRTDSIATKRDQPVTQERTATSRDESARQNAVVDETTKEQEAAEVELAVPYKQTELPETGAASTDVKKTESAVSKPAESDSRLLPPSISIKKGTLNKQSLSQDRTLGTSVLSLESDSHLEMGESMTIDADSVIIYTETIVPMVNESFSSAPALKERTATGPVLDRLQDSAGRSWDVYRQVFRELDEGTYRSLKLSAPLQLLDSLQAWKDSISVLGPARWYAEQAFRSLQTKETSWDDYQKLRAYIDHYMAESQIPDSTLWNRRLPIVNEIYERQIGKQYRDKK